MVHMQNRRNASLQATGYLLVRVDDTHPQLVVVGYVITITMRRDGHCLGL